MLINAQKSTLSLVQGIAFIGVVLDSTQARAFLSEGWFQIITSLIVLLRDHPFITACSCLRLLGHMPS